MTDRAWKAQERQVAELLASRRNPNSGEYRTDIDAGPFAVEHKARKTLPAWFTAAVAQAARGATEGKTPLVIVSEVRQGRKAQRYVIWRMEDFLAWHGPTGPSRQGETMGAEGANR